MLQFKLPADKLITGMYVAKLDRPWVETPFLFQGFLVKDDNDIRKVRECCEYVFIDVERGKAPAPEAGGTQRPAVNLPPAPIPKPAVHYEVETEVEEELANAQQAQSALSDAVGNLLDDVRVGKPPDIANVKRTVGQVEQSIIRNPDAFMWLRRLKTRDSYTYSHCLDSSVLAIAFGRQMGLPRPQIHDLGVGALMFDVGKMKLPPELLAKPEALTEEEFDRVKQHVEFSVEIMKDIPDMTQSSISLAATHHERFDGSGYPAGLKGGEIPLLGRMAAIVDCFDAITRERPYAAAMSPHQAIRHLYEFRNTRYQEELIEQFIQTLGIYPTGTLVELSNGEVGMVIGQNRVRRLRPKVIVLLGADKAPLGHTPIRDLMEDTVADDGQDLNIVKTLEAGAYGIQPDEFYL